MVKDAESHAAEDRKRRQAIDKRNEADAAAYEVEKQLGELGDNVPTHEKARLTALIADIRTAIKDEEPLEKVQNLLGDLRQAAAGLQVHANQGQACGAGAASQSAGAAGSSPGAGGADDDVIDAEFSAEDDK